MNLDFNRRLSIAPMLDYTDRHDRYFLRLLSKHILLYTEMIPANAIVLSKPELFLKHDNLEHPLAIQFGGSDIKNLGIAAKIAEDYGFSEINLNCGCPSDRVQNGNFGACLMKEKEHVAKCLESMMQAVKIPVSVKCRIGVDNEDSEAFFFDFIETLKNTGCKTFIIHARKAWLKGLSPRENREVPPLNYDRVFLLKEKFKELTISINGGIKTLDKTSELLGKVDGVMIGREAYENPWFLREADAKIFNDNHEIFHSRKELLEAYLPYLEKEAGEGTPLTILTRHLLHLFSGVKGAKKYRQTLSENAPRTKNIRKLISDALSFIEED